MGESREVCTQFGPEGTGAYSQAIRAGDFVFISGQAPLGPVSLDVVGITVEELRDILVEIDAVLYLPER